VETAGILFAVSFLMQ